jgi:hypothetical protein
MMDTFFFCFFAPDVAGAILIDSAVKDGDAERTIL